MGLIGVWFPGLCFGACDTALSEQNVLLKPPPNTLYVVKSLVKMSPIVPSHCTSPVGLQKSAHDSFVAFAPLTFTAVDVYLCLCVCEREGTEQTNKQTLKKNSCFCFHTRLTTLFSI